MNFWVDAQISPAFAPWLSTRFGVVAYALRDLGLRDAPDYEIPSNSWQGINSTFLTRPTVLP